MKRVWMAFLMVAVCFVITACGGSGSTGNGNTVYISASIKEGTSGAVFANFSGVVFNNNSSVLTSANPMNFTITSTPFITTGTVPLSDVNITNILFTFAPVNGAPSFTPVAPSVSYAGQLTPGGSLDIDNVPVLWDMDVQNIVAAAGGVEGQYQYNVIGTFTGVEVNTGAALNTAVNFSAFVSVR